MRAPPGWNGYPGGGALDDALAVSTHPRRTGDAAVADLSPLLARFHAYWNDKRQARFAPSRADIDPAEIPDLLPFVVLTDVLAGPPWLRYRLVGTRQVSLRGRDPTGMAVAGNHTGHTLRGGDPFETLLNYRAVIERGVPVLDFNPVAGPDPGPGVWRGPMYERATLLLPLSADGATVDMVFCCTDIGVV